MRCKFFLIAVVIAFLLPVLGCRTELPAKAPVASNVEYVRSENGLPPMVKGATNIKEIQTIETKVLTAQDINALDLLARSNDTVKQQLGDVSSLLHTYYIDDKDAPAREIVNLTYYSYSNNYAVEVRIENRQVIKDEVMRGFQPPATTAEIDKAISIALENPEVRSAAGQLTAQGIVSYRKSEDREIQDHRIIYVSFSKRENDNIEYFAYVDLIQNKIIEHGKDVKSKDTEDFKKEYLKRGVEYAR
jgi:hypothetical protein